MDLWQLNIFCKVVEQKSFSKAASIIHLSQPTISSHIKYLEDHFECRLIDRLSKEVIPTKSGELLYSYAKKLLSLRDETEDAMADIKGKIEGYLEIGGSTIPGGYILPKIISRFSQKYLNVTISLVIGDTDKIIADTLSGDVELGVVGAMTQDKNIFQEKLIEDEMRIIVPSNHKWAEKGEVEFKDLCHEPFIIREKGSGTLKSINYSFNQRGFNVESLKIVALMGSTEAVIQGIKNNLGISILSTMAVIEDLNKGTLKSIKIKDVELKRDFFLTQHKNRTISLLGRTFIVFLKKECAKGS